MPNIKRYRTKPQQAFLNLPSAPFPSGTPHNSKRSRKYYSELVDDREFLKHLKQIWQEKLNDLKEDHAFLMRMKHVQKQQVKDMPPLFSREEEKKEEVYHSNITLPVEEEKLKLITSLEELEKFDKQTTRTTLNEEEDDDEIRRKLHLALQEFNTFYDK